MIPRPDLPRGVSAGFSRGPVRRVVAHGPPGRDTEEDTMRKTLTAAALALAALAPATAANAAAPQDDYVDRFHNAATGRALDDSEFGLRPMPVYLNDHQAWNVHTWDGGGTEMRNVATGNCLDDSDEFGLRAFPCNQTPFQTWFRFAWDDGTVTLVNEATGRALDDSEEFGLRTFERNDGPWQRW
ncbi:hypothetical protein GCM10018963_16000 [Saccharothrix longispora]